MAGTYRPAEPTERTTMTKPAPFSKDDAVVLDARFWGKTVQIADGDKAGCIEWAGAVNSAGVPIIRMGAYVVTAYRLACAVGEQTSLNGIKGRLVLHACDNPVCVNPSHLRSGTHAENMAEMVARGRARNGATGRHEDNVARAERVAARRAEREA